MRSGVNVKTSFIVSKSGIFFIGCCAAIAFITRPAWARPQMPSPERQLEYAIVGALEISSKAWGEQNFKGACVAYGHLSAMLDKSAKSDGDFFKRLGSQDSEALIVEAYSRWAAACDVSPFQR
jgi:hypothetical protein